MRFLIPLILMFPSLQSEGNDPEAAVDYRDYHEQVIQAEMRIGRGDFRQALDLYEDLFESYDFVFLREYKVAAQIALHLEDKERAFQLIRMGLTAGWEMKGLKKEGYLTRLQKEPEWKHLEDEYPEFRDSYLKGLDLDTRSKVQEMFNKDQKKAMGALFRLGPKAQERYALERFAPHSEQQVKKLIGILETLGYPGEKLIGNDFWASTLLSHHNSISQDYAHKDTLYPYLRPLLLNSIDHGEMSPYEFALVDDWQIAVSSGRSMPGYGFLDPPVQETLEATNQLRNKIGLRSVELRNELIDIESQTGMDFHLPDWIEGKIEIRQE